MRSPAPAPRAGTTLPGPPLHARLAFSTFDHALRHLAQRLMRL